MHSNECSKFMCVMEQNHKINYNMYTYINVQQRVTIFNIYREYMYIWNMYWWNSNVETITEIKLCSSFNLSKGKNLYIKSSVTSREMMNVIIRETKSTLQIFCTDIFHVNTFYCTLKNKCITRKYNRYMLIIICQLCHDFYFYY
jgi:hypothetical protein